jgi:hypothetical protein
MLEYLLQKSTVTRRRDFIKQIGIVVSKKLATTLLLSSSVKKEHETGQTIRCNNSGW